MFHCSRQKNVWELCGPTTFSSLSFRLTHNWISLYKAITLKSICPVTKNRCVNASELVELVVIMWTTYLTLRTPHLPAEVIRVTLHALTLMIHEVIGFTRAPWAQPATWSNQWEITWSWRQDLTVSRRVASTREKWWRWVRRWQHKKVR